MNFGMAYHLDLNMSKARSYSKIYMYMSLSNIKQLISGQNTFAHCCINSLQNTQVIHPSPTQLVLRKMSRGVGENTKCYKNHPSPSAAMDHKIALVNSSFFSREEGRHFLHHRVQATHKLLTFESGYYVCITILNGITLVKSTCKNTLKEQHRPSNLPLDNLGQKMILLVSTQTS